MSPEDILSQPPRVLSASQRADYFENGYLFLEAFIGHDWLDRVNAAVDEVVERSRSVSASNREFVLEPDHSASEPRLRRLNCAADRHPVLWAFASESEVPDVVADLVGPDVKYRESMINFKFGHGGGEVGWHQDIPFYPHTNRTPLITMTFLHDVHPEMGPLRVIPGSHELGFFDHYDSDGEWAGRISDADLESVPVERARSLSGPRGSVAIIHGGMIHGSVPNRSERWRPLLICGYSSADAFSYTPLGNLSKYRWQIVRGKPATHAHHEPMQVRIPPDWSEGYTSIFEAQKGEQRESG